MFSHAVRVFAIGVICWSAWSGCPACAQVALEEQAASETAIRPLPLRGGDILDIALSPAGELSGRVLDDQGAALPNAVVKLRRLGQSMHCCQADGDGRFALSGMRGGVFQIEAAGTIRLCRVWVAETQPPGAQREVLLIASESSTRDASRREARNVRWWINNHSVMTSAVSAAIVAPIVLTTDSKDAG